MPYNFIFPEDTLLDLSLSFVQVPEGSYAMPFAPDLFALPSDLAPGKELKVVGFPVSVPVPNDIPFVKSGMVSAIPDTSGYYYIDSNVFPGNSGGAVIIAPPEAYLWDLQSDVDALAPMMRDSTLLREVGRQLNPRLAGIVVGYLPYRDVAISQQTKIPRVVFEENSGITLVVTPQALLRFLQNRK